ncbi:outer membrane beta-barrel protein [bacterium]|nr:outer membrane beta-barrel protein [bacterium]
MMIKKTYALVLILLAGSSAILSAGEFAGSGFLLGLNHSTFVGRDTPEAGISYAPGLAIGGFVSYKVKDFELSGFSGTFSIRQELTLTTKGSKINSIGELQLTNIFIYLELPLLAKVVLLPEKPVRPHVLFGPAYAVKIFAMNNVGVLEDIRTTDLGLILGGGLEFWKMALDIRCDFGLMNFDTSADDIDLRNRTFSVRVGYYF